MAITKAIPAATVNLMINDIASSTMVIYSTMTTNPANAAAITGVIATRTLTPTTVGSDNADYGLVAGTSLQVKAGSAITASGSGTATCVILKTGSTSTDGVIKLIDTGTTVLTSGQQYTPAAFTYTINQPT